MAAAQSSLETRHFFAQHILHCNNDLSKLQQAFQQAFGNESDKKSIFEQSFRDVMRDIIVDSHKTAVESCKSLVVLAIHSAEADICYHSVPFLLLSDAFDCITLNLCEHLFDVVESHVKTWTKPTFFSSGKILLLRMCNDLLRRLSSSQNTLFCGRIQLFLARLFPLSEKSALNLMSHFNLENVTSYNAKKPTTDSGKQKQAEEEEGEEMELELPSENTLASERPVDYNLYQKLWYLQDFFRQPTQCFHTDRWKTFTATVHEVLQSFSSYKLEHIQTKKRSKNETMEITSQTFTSSHYFAKYLTSENLVNLQLSDSHFRRHVLIQLLILFQYLTGDIKFKNSSQILTDAQALWVSDTSNKVYSLLSETPPDGKQFADYIRLVIQREETWITWKNEGCPSFEKSQPQSSIPTQSPRVRLGDKLYKMKEEKDIGSKELSRLWNLCPDNLDSCTSAERIFVPPLDIFLEEALEQAKPESQVSKEDKTINKPNYCWQALRLLSRESPHFFPYSNQSQIRPLDEYLENVIVQTAKDFQTNGSS